MTRQIIEHTRYIAGYKALEACHATGRDGLPVENLKLLGASGTGKSTLLRDYHERHPPYDLEDRTVMPVVYAKVPSKPTPLRLAGRILRGMRSPFWDRGKEEERTYQLVTLCQECKVEFILLDEGQCLVDQGQVKTHMHVTDWIKDLQEEIDKPVAIAGLKRLQLLDEANDQFARRFSVEVGLDRMDPDNAQDRGLILGIVNAQFDDLQLELSSQVDAEDLAWRAGLASDGRFGYLWKLSVAIKRGRRDAARPVTLQDFADTFQSILWTTASAQRNPFSPKFDGFPLDRVGEPFHPDAATQEAKK